MHKVIELFNNAYQLKEIDVKDFKKMKVGPIRFDIAAYEIPNIGRLSYMKGKAMLGLMKMDTIIITSYKKDVPLFSYDRIKVGKKDTFLIESYDTCKNKCDYPTLDAIKEKFSSYSKYEPKPAWYDTIRRKESVAVTTKGKNNFDFLLEEYINAVIDIINNADDISIDEKKILNEVYVNGLQKNGGASTDMFLKKIGEEKTSELFRKYLFGTED